MYLSNNKKCWFVIIYTLFIFASIPCARQIWDFVVPKNGSIAVLLAVYASAVVLVYLGYRNLLSAVLVVVAVVFVFKTVKLPIERIHLIQYGVLGWLSYWAAGWKGFIYASLIGVLDEFIQRLTPGRYFDVKDIYFNLTSVSLGSFISWYER